MRGLGNPGYAAMMGPLVWIRTTHEEGRRSVPSCGLEEILQVG